MNKTVRIPSINDSSEGYRSLVKLDLEIHRIVSDFLISKNDILTMSFNFESCLILKQNGVSYLGAISYWLKEKGVKLYYQVRSLVPDVFKTLSEDGFLGSNFERYHKKVSVDAKHIQFNHFSGDDENRKVTNKIQMYITDEWLAKANIHFSNRLKQDITVRLYELFANALEHSNSEIGCVANGQSTQNDIDLCVIDLGRGIADNVKKFCAERNELVSSSQAVGKAFMSGFTTRNDNSGGLGLALIKDFLQLNKGSLDVYCNDVHLKIDPAESEPIIATTEEIFQGTILNVKLQKDGQYYSYRNE
ncbi:ATP-binding protein [Levilactobacillus brevis]|uniref:ATP-binding protein n=1 Tax=Levilactobacillus brevis TaxID=1580 RepID=UPI0022710350|nr:ATP-binding protein [Levilactobacillus brevis]